MIQKKKQLNLNTVKENIAYSIHSNGGEEFRTLSEVPDRISNLVKKYNKVAIIEKQVEVPYESIKNYEDIVIPLGLDFDPNIVLFLIERTNGIISSTNKCYSNELGITLHEGAEKTCEIATIEKSRTSVKLRCSIVSLTSEITAIYKISKFIAIG